MYHIMVLSMFVHVWFGPTLIYKIGYYEDKQWDKYECATDKQNIERILPLTFKYRVLLTCSMEEGA